jgi:CheY-like chemotaxis protein
MDGYAVANAVRRETAARDVTLIALTGWGQAEDRQRARAAGFDHHLIKPPDLGALEQLLRGTGSDPHGSGDEMSDRS